MVPLPSRDRPLRKSLRFWQRGQISLHRPPGVQQRPYQSREDTGYAGEATIKRIVINEDPLAFFETFGDAVFLTKEEAKAYVANQERWQGVRKEAPRKRPWMALELEGIREYDSVKKPERFVPVGGRYLKE